MRVFSLSFGWDVGLLCSPSLRYGNRSGLMLTALSATVSMAIIGALFIIVSVAIDNVNDTSRLDSISGRRLICFLFTYLL